MMIKQTDGPTTVPRNPGARSPSSTPAVAPAKPVDAVQPPPEPAREQLEAAVQQANRQMSAVAPSLQFEIDPDTDQVVIRLVDRQDQRVLRQVPSAEMLAIARALERMQSLMVRTRA
jgi:flagellar protein FlaG